MSSRFEAFSESEAGSRRRPPMAIASLLNESPFNGCSGGSNLVAHNISHDLDRYGFYTQLCVGLERHSLKDTVELFLSSPTLGLDPLKFMLDPSIMHSNAIRTEHHDLPIDEIARRTGTLPLAPLTERYPFIWFQNLDGSHGVPFVEILQFKATLKDADQPIIFSRSEGQELILDADNFFINLHCPTSLISNPKKLFRALEGNQHRPSGMQIASRCNNTSHRHSLPHQPWQPLPIRKFLMAFLAVQAIIKYLKEAGKLRPDHLRHMRLHAVFSPRRKEMDVWHPIVTAPIYVV